MEEKKLSFFIEIGGMATIKKVHKIFYDKIYADAWIGQFFKKIDQTVIEDQQSDFMAQSFGGPNLYLGKLPVATHKHMYITEELFELRRSLLEMSLIEAKVSPEHRERWLKIDGAFKHSIVKKSLADCEKRYFTDELEAYENPFAGKERKAS